MAADADRPQATAGSTHDAATERSHDLRLLLAGAGTSFVGKGGGLVLRFFTQLVLAWMLGPARFGLYALASGVFQIAELVSRLGLGSGVIRYVAMHRERGDQARLKGILSDALRVPLLTGAAAAALLLWGADFLAVHVFHDPGLGPVLSVFALGVPFSAAMMVLAMATTGFDVTRYMVGTIHILQPLVNLLLVGFAAGLGLGLLGVSVAWSLSFGVALVAAIASVRHLTSHIGHDVRTIRVTGELTRFSLPLMAGELLWVLMLWTDILMLGYYRPSVDVGIYRAAAQLAILLTVIPFSVESIFGPMIARLNTTGDRERLGGLFQVSTRWSITASVPLVLVVVLVPADLLSLYGPGFGDARLPLLILAAGQLVNSATGSVSSMLIMTGHQYMKLTGDIIVAVVNVTLNVLLIPQWGLVGAAFATGVSVAGTNVLRLIQVWVAVRIQPYDRSYFKPILAAGGAGAAGALLAGRLEGVHFLISLVGTTIVVLSVFAGLIWALGPEPEDRELLLGGLRRLRPEEGS